MTLNDNDLIVDFSCNKHIHVEHKQEVSMNMHTNSMHAKEQVATFFLRKTFGYVYISTGFIRNFCTTWDCNIKIKSDKQRVAVEPTLKNSYPMHEWNEMK